jgi:hypothetical protein
MALLDDSSEAFLRLMDSLSPITRAVLALIILTGILVDNFSAQNPVKMRSFSF